LDITWLGHAAIRMRARDAAVVMDPTDRSTGIDMGRPPGEIVTVSHDHPHHNHVTGVKGEVMLLDGPGEYEISGIHVQGLRASLRPIEGADPSALRSTIFIFEAEELRLAHLGGLGTLPTALLSEHLSNLDVLIVSIDCEQSLTPQQAARATRALEPRIVIPVAYEPATDGVAAPLQAFLQDVGLTPDAPTARLTLNRRTVGGESTRVLLLESRG
jgi:L-ascorbate metabolism protein UlaG (beta-lactamase superfamily)